MVSVFFIMIAYCAESATAAFLTSEEDHILEDLLRMTDSLMSSHHAQDSASSHNRRGTPPQHHPYGQRSKPFHYDSHPTFEYQYDMEWTGTESFAEKGILMSAIQHSTFPDLSARCIEESKLEPRAEGPTSLFHYGPPFAQSELSSLIVSTPEVDHTTQISSTPSQQGPQICTADTTPSTAPSPISQSRQPLCFTQSPPITPMSDLTAYTLTHPSPPTHVAQPHATTSQTNVLRTQTPHIYSSESTHPLPVYKSGKRNRGKTHQTSPEGALFHCMRYPENFCVIVKEALQISPDTSTDTLLTVLAQKSLTDHLAKNRLSYIALWRLGILLHHQNGCDESIFQAIYTQHPPQSKITTSYFSSVIRMACLLRYAQSQNDQDIFDLEQAQSILDNAPVKSSQHDLLATTQILNVVERNLTTTFSHPLYDLSEITPQSSLLSLCSLQDHKGQNVAEIRYKQCSGFNHQDVCCKKQTSYFPCQPTHPVVSSAQIFLSDIAELMIQNPSQSCDLFLEIPTICSTYQMHTFSEQTKLFGQLLDSRTNSNYILTLTSLYHCHSDFHNIILSFLCAHYIDLPNFHQHYLSVPKKESFKDRIKIAYALSILPSQSPDIQNKYHKHNHSHPYDQILLCLKDFVITSPIMEMLTKAQEPDYLLNAIRHFEHASQSCSSLTSTSLDSLRGVNLSGPHLTLSDTLLSESVCTAAQRIIDNQNPECALKQLAKLHSITFSALSDIFSQIISISAKTRSASFNHRNIIFLLEASIISLQKTNVWSLDKFAKVRDYLFKRLDESECRRALNSQFYPTLLRDIMKITCLLQIWQKEKWDGHDCIKWDNLDEVFNYCTQKHSTAHGESPPIFKPTSKKRTENPTPRNISASLLASIHTVSAEYTKRLRLEVFYHIPFRSLLESLKEIEKGQKLREGTEKEDSLNLQSPDFLMEAH